MKNKIMPYLLPIRCVIFLAVFLIGTTIANKKVDEISNWWSIAASIVNIATILLLIFICKKQRSSYSKLINYKKGKTTVKQIIAVSAVILIVGMTGMYLAGFVCYGVIPYAAPMMIEPIPLWLAAVNIIILPVSTAFAEEGLYLGCGVNQIKNKYAAVILPALFFAVQHSFIPVLFDAKYIIYRFLSFLPLTLILCWYYYKKRNPLPIMIGHGIIDVATVMQIFATSLYPELYEKMCAM
ncbi:MAG: CPBP family intramembrane metalloprotease [Oscillospiraceae bacterium]|nr:CPBP family intramembrane metalloprotease [Oscillospiraceae bacterium]